MNQTKNSYISLDNETVWPNPLDPKDLEWRLRYDKRNINPNELLIAASYMASYKFLFSQTDKDRNKAINKIKKELREKS